MQNVLLMKFIMMLKITLRKRIAKETSVVYHHYSFLKIEFLFTNALAFCTSSNLYPNCFNCDELFYTDCTSNMNF